MVVRLRSCRGHGRLVPHAVRAAHAHVGHPTVVGLEVRFERNTQRGRLSADRPAECHERESRNSSHKRESDRELGAATLHVRGADRTAVCLGDRLRDREAEAGPIALRVVAAVEALKETRLRALRQP